MWLFYTYFVLRWYIYKPPSVITPYLELGRNFTYITSSNAGRWQPSDKFITSSSMLQHTLSPIYRSTYVDYLAVAVYETGLESDAKGVLLADEMGGVWIGHTVPGLVNLNDDRPTFPDNERANGHLLMCLSIDLLAINEIAFALHTVRPKFTHVRIAKKLVELLPHWNFQQAKKKRKKATEKVTFSTNGKSMLVEVLARPFAAYVQESLYQKFATDKNLALDVYDPTDRVNQSSMCDSNQSVRNIETISLKLRETVQYISNDTDRTKFAVSTLTPWQKLQSLPSQYWTCTTNLDKEDKSGKGGLIACVENYSVWLTFEKFKINEPKC